MPTSSISYADCAGTMSVLKLLLLSVAIKACSAGRIVLPRQGTASSAVATPSLSPTPSPSPSSNAPSSAPYTLVDDYSTASAFFGGFTFFTDPDPTNGHVTYVDQDTAFSRSLAGLNPSTNNSIYLGVDATSPAPSGRNSTRLTSNKIYNHGLFVLDLLHMPGGICGVWPAFWLLGTGTWPANGEIDVLEGVNESGENEMTLHTGSGCAMTPQNSSSYAGTKYSGSLATADCDINDPAQAKNAGCGIDDTRPATFGTQYNAHGGGVVALQWTSDSINIWNFPRSAVPANLASDAASPAPDTAKWGLPAASFGSQGCPLDQHVKDQQIVFDTTFCGDWAGQVWTSTPSCMAKAPTCEQFVSDNPSAFVDAYWEIKGLRVYQNGQ